MSDTSYAPHTPAWKALQAHAERLARTHIHALFAEAPHRGETFSAGLDCVCREKMSEKMSGLYLPALTSSVKINLTPFPVRHVLL